MAPVGKFVKALFLGLVSTRNWRRSSSSSCKNAKKWQVLNGGAFSQEIYKPPTKGRSSGAFSQELCKPNTVDKVCDDILRVLGTIGTLKTVCLMQLPDGSRIAVKRLDTSQIKLVEDFAAEATLLGNIRHRNVLSLCGFCAEGNELLIAYEYMVNLSLHTHLHGSSSSRSVLGWSRRISIAIGAAEGLAHLHHEVTPQFIHGEVKSRNLLLDAKFEAKWADFGLMRLVEKGSFLSGGSNGGVGYLPPEYHMRHEPSQSGDVFGFGILLLELISGKKPLERWETSGKKNSIWGWAEPLIAVGRYSELVDPRLGRSYTRDALNLVFYVATMCAQSNSSSRLTMIEAVELLKCGSARIDKEFVLDP